MKDQRHHAADIPRTPSRNRRCPRSRRGYRGVGRMELVRKDGWPNFENPPTPMAQGHQHEQDLALRTRIRHGPNQARKSCHHT